MDSAAEPVEAELQRVIPPVAVAGDIPVVAVGDAAAVRQEEEVVLSTGEPTSRMKAE